MRRRVLTMLVIPLALGACERGALAPEEPDVGVVPVPAGMNLTHARVLALSAALADARTRLLPAIAGDEDAPSPLGAALRRLDEGLAADDPAVLEQAVVASEAVLASLPAEDADAMAVELDAIRLLLGELRFSARGGKVDPEP
jgi:hypothetical protein